jgi:hypothetical protein
MSKTEASEKSSLFIFGVKKKFVIKYDIAVQPTTGQIFWISGGVCDTVPDFTILRGNSSLN